MQPAQQRVTACQAANCAMRRMTLQAGAPVVTKYLDRLGRVIATAAVPGSIEFDGVGMPTFDPTLREVLVTRLRYLDWPLSLAPKVTFVQRPAAVAHSSVLGRSLAAQRLAAR
jgi:hypothetical protein